MPYPISLDWIAENPALRDAEYWCQDCDDVKVLGSNPESGRYFLQFGVEYRVQTKFENGRRVSRVGIGDLLEPTIYALCYACISKEIEALTALIPESVTV